MDVSNLAGKLVLVTGAGSGIGRETALAFARRGADLAICDVDEAGLGRTADDLRSLGRQVLAQRVDVARAEDMRAFADAVHRQTPAVDILVNNAGVGLGAGFLETSLEDWNWILDINVRGVVHGCHFFLPAMVARGQPAHVVIVASAAAFVATESLAAYATTKFAVFGLAEALRDELARRGIGVTAVCPGIINTPITQSSRLRGRAARPGAREELVAMYRRRNYGPERVAEAIVAAVGRNAAVAPVSPEAWLMYFMKRLSPGLSAWLNRQAANRFERQLQQRIGP